MTFLVSTRRPVSTEQSGVVTNTYVGAASFHAATADSSDLSYVRLGARASLELQRVRMSVQAPVLAATDRVYSVGVRARIRSVIAGSDTPLLLLWLRTESGEVTVAGQLPDVFETPFEVYTPVEALSSSWVDVDLGQFVPAPGGQLWDQNGNLTSLSIDLGRGDDYAPNLDVAALYFDVYYQQISTITPTGPADGDDTRPTWTWEYDSPNYAAQQGYRLAGYTLAQTLDTEFEPYVTPAQFTTGIAGDTAETSWWEQSSAQRWGTPVDLTDDTYVVFFQATSQWAGGGGDFYTEITSLTWTRDGSTAGPPDAALLTSVEYSYAEMGTLVTFEPDGATDAFTLERSTDGVVWAPASPGLVHILADGLNPITVTDRFMPLNTPSQYRVISFAGSPLVAAQAPSNILDVTPADDRYIFRHPTNPLLDVAIEIKNPKADEGIKRTKRQMQGLAYFTGGPRTRVLPQPMFGPTYGWEYDLTLLYLMLENPDLWDQVDQLDEAQVPLFFQLPTRGEQMWGALGPGATGRDTEEALSHVAGNRAKYQRIVRKTNFTECMEPETYT